MLNFGNKEFRNLQEQVLKNMADIKDIHEGATVLGEFGIKVVGQVDSADDLPDPTEYEGEYGDAYVVGEETPYDYYIFTRPFEDVDDPQWFNLGQFPAPGPQGETGATGATGATPNIGMEAYATTLSAGQSATVSVTKTGTAEEPHFELTFAIPQGAQGIQGVQGAQGIQGPQGPQGIQGQKGDTGYLYTIIGQVNDASSLPLPGQVGRTSAFLVGTQEPYDVYVIIGQDLYDLEWLNIGPIATVVPTTYIASETDASSGTLDATTLAAITNETGVHYIRVGSELYEYANTYNGNAYYMSLRYDGSVQMSKVARFIVALSSGAWTTGSDTIPDTEHTVYTNTAQTISGNKTFSGNLYIGDNTISLNKNSFGNLAVNIANTPRIKVSSAATQFATNLYPETTGTYDIGLSGGTWKDLWLSGYLRDGTNSILISDIVTKATAQTITGTKTFTGGLIVTDEDSYPYHVNIGYDLNTDYETCIFSDRNTSYPIAICGYHGVTIDPDPEGDEYFLRLMNIPTYDPYDDYEDGTMVWSDNGTLKLAGATGGGGGDSNFYEQTLSNVVLRYYDDNESEYVDIATLNNIKIITAINPLQSTDSSDQSYGIVVDYDRHISITTTLRDKIKIAAPTSLYFTIPADPGGSYDSGYLLSNIRVWLGSNVYESENGGEELNLVGTFYPNSIYTSLVVKIEILNSGRSIAVMDN